MRKIWATSVIFKKLPNVINRPIGEKFAHSGHPAINQKIADSRYLKK
jgi:hypothetical protein